MWLCNRGTFLYIPTLCRCCFGLVFGACDRRSTLYCRIPLSGTIHALKHVGVPCFEDPDNAIPVAFSFSFDFVQLTSLLQRGGSSHCSGVLFSVPRLFEVSAGRALQSREAIFYAFRVALGLFCIGQHFLTHRSSNVALGDFQRSSSFGVTSFTQEDVLLFSALACRPLSCPRGTETGGVSIV